jgi:extracellular factor (EF) 3-hydroxypalmitic acid methyl ester biosynthesis protein
MTPATAWADTLTLLDETAERLRRGDGGDLSAMMPAFDRVRRALPRSEWLAFTTDVARKHPVFALIQEDPSSRRSFEKPRDYPGDAVILDLLYGDIVDPGPMSAAGKLVNRWTLSCAAPRSVQLRRSRLTDLLDETASHRAGCRVLSVACGHLREGQSSTALRAGRIAELVALDQDQESLAVVEREQGHTGVRPLPGTVKDLLVGKIDVQDFDLAYAAGLYDYLDLRTATALTANLLARLSRGGHLLVANFAPELPDIAYMEAMIDWHLIYRDETEMRVIAEGAAAKVAATYRLFRDEPGNIIYLELRRT